MPSDPECVAAVFGAQLDQNMREIEAREYSDNKTQICLLSASNT